MRVNPQATVMGLLLPVTVAGLAEGQTRGPEIARTNPAGIATPRGYTHVVTARGGKTVWIAGQVAADEKGAVVGKADMKAQTRQVFANLKTALAAAGATFKDVVKMNTYVVGLTAETLSAVREVRTEVLAGVEPPASTLVGVVALANPDFLIEIEVVAVVE